MTPFKIAARSPCRYKVAAFGFDKKGECIGSAYNIPRLNKFGGGVHAEINLLRRVNIRKLRSILVIRASKSGRPSHIDVCPSCERVLTKLGIKIITDRRDDFLQEAGIRRK